MIERIVENWLINVSERDFEIPFCQMLAADGYEVVHLTRHGPTEEGKDVIAVAPNGDTVTYQLKSGNLSLADWHAISGEVHDLVTLKPRHPSIARDKWHKAFLVTTGQLSEEVRLRIGHFNADHAGTQANLDVIVRGQLLKRFVSLHGEFLPVQLPDLSRFLKLLLGDGYEFAPAAEIARLLMSVLPLAESDSTHNKAEIARALASALILSSYLSSTYHRAANHVALIDLWVITASHVLAVAERFGLEKKYWYQTFMLAYESILSAFDGLIGELENRNHYFDGDPLTDNLVLRARITLLVGYLSAYSVSCRMRDNKKNHLDILDELIGDQARYAWLWGEAALPQFLAYAWYLEQGDRPEEALRLVEAVLQGLLGTQDSKGLPDPYHDLHSVLEDMVGVKSIGERFAGLSYGLQTYVEWLARRDRRTEVERMWKLFTDTQQAEMVPEQAYETYLWRAECGEVRCTCPELMQSWGTIRSVADGYSVEDVPSLLRDIPWFAPLFLLVYPHRLRPLLAWWVDHSLC